VPGKEPARDRRKPRINPQPQKYPQREKQKYPEQKQIERTYLGARLPGSQKATDRDQEVESYPDMMLPRLFLQTLLLRVAVASLTVPNGERDIAYKVERNAVVGPSCSGA
jgi:hypothetical protein